MLHTHELGAMSGSNDDMLSEAPAGSVLPTTDAASSEPGEGPATSPTLPAADGARAPDEGAVFEDVTETAAEKTAATREAMEIDKEPGAAPDPGASGVLPEEEELAPVASARASAGTGTDGGAVPSVPKERPIVLDEPEVEEDRVEPFLGKFDGRLERMTELNSNERFLNFFLDILQRFKINLVLQGDDGSVAMTEMFQFVVEDDYSRHRPTLVEPQLCSGVALTVRNQGWIQNITHTSNQDKLLSNFDAINIGATYLVKHDDINTYNHHRVIDDPVSLMKLSGFVIYIGLDRGLVASSSSSKKQTLGQKILVNEIRIDAVLTSKWQGVRMVRSQVPNRLKLLDSFVC